MHGGVGTSPASAGKHKKDNKTSTAPNLFSVFMFFLLAQQKLPEIAFLISSF